MGFGIFSLLLDPGAIIVYVNEFCSLVRFDLLMHFHVLTIGPRYFRQAKMSTKKSSDGFSREVDHFSPGCVLDASFSNDSCISSSFDDNSGK